MGVDCNWSWLPGSDPPDHLRHYHVQEDQKKEGKQGKASKESSFAAITIEIGGWMEEKLFLETTKRCNYAFFSCSFCRGNF